MANIFKRVIAVCIAFTLIIGLVTVPASAASVKLNKTKATLTVGKTLQLKVTGTKGKITWSTSKKSVATVSKSGKVTTKKAGTATITAKTGSKSLKCEVTVTAQAENNLKDNNTKTKKGAEKLYISKGKSFTLKFYKDNGKAYGSKDVKYQSLDTSVAKVTKSGKVTGVNYGSTIILATVAGKTYEIATTIEKPVAYDFSGVTQTDWHRDWIQGVNWDQIDQKNGSSFTCKMKNTSQKVTWTAKVIYASKPSHPVKSPDEIIKGSEKGVLSGNSASNKIVFNGEGSQYITVEVIGKTADGQKLTYYIFYNDKEGNSMGGPRWNEYFSLEEFQKATYDNIKKKYPQAICIEEKDAKFNYLYPVGDNHPPLINVSKEKAFHQYKEGRLPTDTGVYMTMADGTEVGAVITGALFGRASMEHIGGFGEDHRIAEIVEGGAIPVIYITWYPKELTYKNCTIKDTGGLFFDGTFWYNIRGEQAGACYYAIGSTSAK